MSPIGFTRHEEKKYEGSIFSKIKLINKKNSEYKTPQKKTQLDVLGDNGKTEATIRRRYEHKKTKSEINLAQKFLRINSEIDYKPLSNGNYHSRHLDPVDIALLKHSQHEYFNDNASFYESKNKEKIEEFMNIESFDSKKMFFFPKVNFKN